MSRIRPPADRQRKRRPRGGARGAIHHRAVWRGPVRLRALAATALVAACCWSAAACGETEPAAVQAAPMAIETPIGPIPGAAEERPAAQNPFAGTVDALAEGRRFFVWYNCAGCHGDHGGGGMGPSLRDAVWLYGSSDAQIGRASCRERV